MTNQTTLWNDFKNLVWWEKIILFIPFVFTFVIIALFFTEKFDFSKEKLIKRNKNKTDIEIKTFKKNLIEIEKKRQEIQTQRAKTKEEIKNAEINYANFIKYVDSTNDPDELSRIAEELRMEIE
jgi:septal ring factor EnvC (AmiA/AmiB activator)